MSRPVRIADWRPAVPAHEMLETLLKQRSGLAPRVSQAKSLTKDMNVARYAPQAAERRVEPAYTLPTLNSVAAAAMLPPPAQPHPQEEASCRRRRAPSDRTCPLARLFWTGYLPDKPSYFL